MASFAILFVSMLALPAVIAGTPKSCTIPQLSCANTTAVSDLCCFNAPGGQLLQTQFWDTNPSTGPSDSWTIHGLWPDHCDGTFDANCDPSREYTNITAIIKASGQTELLSYMSTYWKDYQGDDETFWEHEWSKHGTCISTLEPKCYSGYKPQEEVVDFFQKTVDLFKSLNSYAMLSKAGIVPSTTKTYTSAQIQAALKSGFGYEVTIQCDSSALNEIWYTYGVRGSVATVSTKIGSETPTTTSGAPTQTPTGGTGGFSGSGQLNAISGGAQKGCLISAGTWYSSGTCATYTSTASGSGFILKSSKGSCGISNSILTCGSGVTSTLFTAVNGKLAYNGNTNFYAAAVPSGTAQQSVYTTSKSITVSFQWQSI